ncbi:MAG TPA: hypothetical protein VF152_11075, partial [Acidimicrobiia bacterium]
LGLVVVGGGAALAVRAAGDGGDGPTRDGTARTTAPAPDAAADEQGALASGAVDLGEVAGPADLRRSLAALRDPRSATPPADEGGTESEAAPVLPAPCLATLEDAGAPPPVTLVASARYQGSPALVVVGGAGEQAFVLDQADPARCGLVATVPLV